MNIKIRDARESDLPVLKWFQSKLIVFEKPFDDTIIDGNTRYYNPKSCLKSKKNLMLVAEDNGKVIGGGFCKIEKEPNWSKNKNRGHIGVLFVEKEYRRKGIGSRIIDELVKWLKKKNITDVRIQVYSKNTNAINAYKKYGFKEHILEMRLNTN